MKNKGQVWIETVLYTLVGLAIIGILLALIKPSIEEKKDSLNLQQAIDILNGIDNSISDIIYYGTGNSRQPEVSLRKGTLVINGASDADSIVFSMESRYMFSQLGSEVKIGKISALTTEKSKKLYNVELRIDYNKNFTIDGMDSERVLQPSSTPYTLTIINKGNSLDFSVS
jgi:type II secretory pathway pseudopilin PulG